MLVARADSGIMKVSDIKGRRINIGNPGSGQRGNATDILRIYGINKDKDIKAEGLQQGGANRALGRWSRDLQQHGYSHDSR